MRIYLLPIGLLAAGISIFLIGLLYPALPEHWDDQLLRQTRFRNINAGNEQAVTDEWFAERAKIQSPRSAFEDWGLSFTFSAFGIAILFAHLRIKFWRDIFGLRSPTSRASFLTKTTVVWLSFIPAAWVYYIYTSVRDDYPPFGDIVFIPMAGDAIFGILLLPIVLIGAARATRRRHLNVLLWARPTVIWTSPVALMIWPALALSMMVLLIGILNMPPIIPSSLFTIYMLLCARATTTHPL